KAKIKDYKKVSIEIEYKEVSDPHFCTYNISNKIIVVGNLECLRQAISNFAFRAILTNEELLPMAFLSIERVSFLSLYSLISSQIYSALLARPLALDFLKWLSPTVHEEEFYKVKLVVEHPTKIRAMIKDKEIPISLLSSGLGQLSILEFLVRNPILKSLVIEEPEINLHDDMQIKLGKYLAKNASKKMFITTHSEWFTMSFAYHLRNLRIFELREKEENLFEAKEVEVYEDGSIGELQSIHKPHDKFLNEMIENILKYGETDK
ncbi:MAG: AAA family ATPase, partial [Sulfolobaceae archaeon]